MTFEEFNTKSTEVLEKLDDQGAVSIILDELRAGFGELTEKVKEVEADNAELREKNDKLQTANMELFLKVGNPVKEEEEKEEEVVVEKIKYDDLFDDNGELKKGA